MFFALLMYLLGLQVQYREGMTVVKNSFQAFVFAARPNTLTAAIAPVLVGATMAAMDVHPIPDKSFSWIPYFLCLGFAVGMQIAANLINDLYDFKKGSDSGERLGPPRACAMGWVDEDVMKKWIVRVVVLSLAIGFPVVFYAGWILVPIGALCALFAFLYTSWFSYRGLGDVLVLIFFGLVPVCGTYYIEALDMSWRVVAVSLGMGVVVDMLLVVNNFRDFENDLATGKRTLVVITGKRPALWVFLAMGIAGALSTLVLFPEGVYLPTLMIMPFLVLHVLAFFRMKRIYSGRELNKVLGSTATNIFIFGFLLSAGFLIQMF